MTIYPESCNVVVLEIDDLFGVIDQSTHIGRRQSLSFADTQDERASSPRHNDLVGMLNGYNSNSERPPNLLQCPADSVLQGTVGRALNQMTQNFGICIRGEMVSLFNQLSLEAFVVLNDAIVDNKDHLSAIGMWVGIGLRRLTVGRPASVAKANRPARLSGVKLGLQILNLSGGPAIGGFSVVKSNDTTGVISPVLQLSQSP
jgi:hypothetical protein